jgi:glycosyltransferase involved in cell wall biosynthesis
VFQGFFQMALTMRQKGFLLFFKAEIHVQGIIMTLTMKVILVHDWLTGMRGGERCLEVFCELFPEAPLYTLIHEPGSLTKTIENRPIFTSSLQKIPFLRNRYQYLLPFFPSLMKAFKVPPADLVISSSHCVAKMFPRPSGAKHWCYLFTPMRYMWDLFDQYFSAKQASFPVRQAAFLMRPYLQNQDLLSNQNVDHFVSISKFIANRVSCNYDRSSEVIYPPVEADRFSPVSSDQIGDWDLVVSAFVPYKRIDLAIEASNRLKRPLKIIGGGEEEKRLKALAGPQVEFLGKLSDEEVAWHMARCRCFVFPGEEDFGITPIEAQAAGRPVVAYAAGGALETVGDVDSENPSGVLFKEQTVFSLMEALKKVDRITWQSQCLRTQVEKFSRERFKREVKRSLENFMGVTGRVLGFSNSS